MEANFFQLPLVGPFREYFNGINEVQKASMNFMKNSFAFSQELFRWNQNVISQTPAFWTKLMETKEPITIMQYTQELIKFLDNNWEQILRSDSYANKSNQFLEGLLEVQNSMKELQKLYMRSLPSSFSTVMEELQKKVNEFQQKTATNQQK